MGCTESADCIKHSDCGYVSATCSFKACTALKCNGCTEKEQCKSTAVCFWDTDDENNYFAVEDCKGCNFLSCSDCKDRNQCKTAHCLWENDQCSGKTCGASAPSSCKNCLGQIECDAVDGCSWAPSSLTCSPTPSPSPTTGSPTV